MRFATALFAVLVGSLCVTAAASSGPNVTQLIKLFSMTTNVDVRTDKAPTGASRGDVHVGNSLLRNAVPQLGKPTGAVVGRDAWRAVYESPSTWTLHLKTTLPGGTITCRGRIKRESQDTAGPDHRRDRDVSQCERDLSLEERPQQSLRR